METKEVKIVPPPAALPKNFETPGENAWISCLLKKPDFLRYVWRHGDIYVAVTNQRIFKIENGKISVDVQINTIAKTFHKKNGIFRWDELVFIMKTGATETMGIYESAAVDYIREDFKI